MTLSQRAMVEASLAADGLRFSHGDTYRHDLGNGFKVREGSAMLERRVERACPNRCGFATTDRRALLLHEFVSCPNRALEQTA
jgi:hypothetical protein